MMPSLSPEGVSDHGEVTPSDHNIIMHPLLAELDLLTPKNASEKSNTDTNKNERQQGDDNPPSNAVSVLNYLLHTQILSEHDLRSAYQKLHKNRTEQVKGNDEIIDTSSKKEQRAELLCSAEGATGVNTTTTAPTTKSEQKQIKKDKSANNTMKTTTTDQTSPAAAAAADTTTRKRRIALHVYYDGGNYSGLAENVGVEGDDSVERRLMAALRQSRLIVTRDSCNYSRCGRTDKGVSAVGQVIALDVKSAFGPTATMDESGKEPLQIHDLPKNSHDTLSIWMVPRKKKHKNKKQQVNNNVDGKARTTTATTREFRANMKEYAYDRILNNLLPGDIRILGWTPVSDEFNARFSATDRLYRYFFVNRGLPHLNPSSIQQALDKLVGTHDFRNFCKMNVEQVYNFERKITSAKIVQHDDKVSYLEIQGQAFLWHQIRCIATVVLAVGRGLESPDIVKELLNIQKYPGKPAYPLADERPLVLHHCGFTNLTMGYSAHNLWTVHSQLQQQWNDLILAAARVRNAMALCESRQVRVEDLVNFAKERCAKKNKKNKINKQNSVFSVALSQTPLLSHATTSWKEALEWMASVDIFPDPSMGGRESVYIPILERSKGTTYEEKVAALQNSAKRKERYVENIIKKRKTKEEDHAFYERMMQQGGSNV